MKLLRLGCRLTVLGLSFWLFGCRAASTAAPATVVPQPSQTSLSQTNQNAYPGLSVATPNYPGPVVNALQTPVAPTDVPTPSQGKATVAGVLYSMSIKSLVPGTLIYLAPGAGPDKRAIPPAFIGPTGTAGSVRGQSNDRAQFILTDVPAGYYYLVVAAPLSWSLGWSAEADQKPLLIEAKENQTLSLGIVYLSWP